MYILKENTNLDVNKTEASKELGITREYLTNILNRKTNCSKVIAFCICKYIDENAEIEDYFVKEV